MSSDREFVGARSWDGFAFGGPDTGRYGGWIQTYTEKQFWPLDPRIEDIDIRDIAHHLSMQCRFSGAVSRHYSVAEHCCRVAELLSMDGQSNMVALWGLLHDASEAYMVDLPRPIKHSPGFEEYIEAEARLMRVVCRAFGLPLTQPEVVESADRRLLATERRDLLGPNCKWEVPDTIPLAGDLSKGTEHLGPSFWEREFLRQYEFHKRLMETLAGV